MRNSSEITDGFENLIHVFQRKGTYQVMEHDELYTHGSKAYLIFDRVLKRERTLFYQALGLGLAIGMTLTGVLWSILSFSGDPPMERQLMTITVDGKEYGFNARGDLIKR